MHHARMTRSRKGAPGRANQTKSFHQRCAVRVTYSRNAVRGQWRAHGRYVARDGAMRIENPDHAAFNDKADALDIASALAEWQGSGDERMWKVIISPEFGERVDLRKLTRELMARMGRDLGIVPEWAAVTHHNTEHPHAHVALRGVDSNGRSLRLDRDYIKNEIRGIAEDLCTRQLGYRSEKDAAESSAREIREHRFTSLDREISLRRDDEAAAGDTFQLVLSRSSADPNRLRQQYIAERMKVLESMGLAASAGPDVWQVRRDFETVLRAMQRANDRQKTMAAHGALVSDERLPLVTLDLKRLHSVEGRVLVHGEEEDGRDAGRGYLLLEGTDAKVHYVSYTPTIEEARNSGGLTTNSFVRLRKLFKNGKPLVEVEDFGSAEAILKSKAHFREAAQQFITRRLLPTEDGWGGWLGRYQAALRNVAIELTARRANAERSIESQKLRGTER
jgi:hypothetical protein